MYGSYEIEKGSYDFNIREMLKIIPWKFEIKEGSSVSFNGDPFAANLNITAIFPVLANLGDLSDALSPGHLRTNVNVHCILGISGDLVLPKLRFDLELPDSDEELGRQVKSIVNTEDMMNRQILYLLTMKKFYTLEGNAGQRNTARTNDLAAFASSTLSSQLSNLLGSMSRNVQISTRMKTSDGNFTDSEFALLLSSQILNNRLTINGNLGYRDNPNISAYFVGDFDIEYKLTHSGDIRLKGYNHYNNLWYYTIRGPVPTQGVGILFKKDFNKITDILPFLNRKKSEKPLPVQILQNKEATAPIEEDDFITFKNFKPNH